VGDDVTPFAAVLAESSAGSDSPTEGIVGVLAGALVLVVPGYVLGRVAGRAGREPDVSDRILAARMAADSILVHTVMMPLTFLLADSVLRHGAAGYGPQILLWLLGVCFLTPVALGGCAVWLAGRSEGTRSGRLARLLGFAAADRFVYAWSAMFAEMPRSLDAPVVRVILRDGRSIRGSFAARAHASDDPASHDLYLDRVYGSDPPSRRHTKSGGIWINGADIVSVEFFLRNEPNTKENRMSEETSAAAQNEPPGAPHPDPAETPARAQPRYRTKGGSGKAADEADLDTESAQSAGEGGTIGKQPSGERDGGRR
jgi:hypothetical protein